MKGNKLKLAEPETKKGNLKIVLTCKSYDGSGMPVPTNWRNALNPISGRVFSCLKYGIKNEVKSI